MTEVFKLIEDHRLTLHGDIEHFAELVRADEREACAKVAEEGLIGHTIAKAIRARDEKSPVHASDISQERVDETAKCGHEPVAWREVAGKTTHYYEYNEEGRGEPLYLHREWVGLDGDIPGLGLVTEEFYNGMLCAEDILRKRNT